MPVSGPLRAPCSRRRGIAVSGRGEPAEPTRWPRPATSDPTLSCLMCNFRDLDGFEVTERLPEDAAVVLVSSRSASSYRRRLAGTRALGFITKADLSGETLAAVLAG